MLLYLFSRHHILPGQAYRMPPGEWELVKLLAVEEVQRKRGD